MKQFDYLILVGRYKFSPRWQLKMVLMGAVIGWSTIASSKIQELVTPEQAYGLALEAQAGQDYAGFIERLHEAAQADYMPAQQLLGMVLLGSTLYGSDVRPDVCEARHWLLRAAENGSNVGETSRALFGRPHGHLPVCK